ncbi:hypothetical protein BDW02DRAFT_76685 [Decorospora gaudefroyi]|uniref:Uncharacterized protein n=1 Tax=Decorospora gaudefroyi TaxID=184978 RepID=A0A6A5K935_9PLEO|nr:hypothetical protein BDW02DRAFT_76685 [Decorospora gaudefroyi]
MKSSLFFILPFFGIALAAAEDPKPTSCICEPAVCREIWPQACYCENEAKKKCFEKCGGTEPTYQSCPPLGTKLRPSPSAGPACGSKKECVCDQVMCIQSWPESCYCANAAKEQCYKKCGGEKPELQDCPPQNSPSLITTTKINTLIPTPTQTSKPSQTHQPCGGMLVGGTLDCPSGYVCITDPYEPGSCGPACDQLGICVRDKICGGFAGFACEEEGQTCVDDPRDDCDPENFGADCAGLCVWPH